MKCRESASNLIARTCLVFVLAPGLSIAQPDDVATIKRQVDIFASILREGLELDGSGGFPLLQSARVEGIYLQGQGVLLEIRTPLAGQRNQASISSFYNSLRTLAGSNSPLTPVERPALLPPQQALTLNGNPEPGSDAYERLRSRMALDTAMRAQNAVRQAEATLQSLSSLRELQQEQQAQIQGELQRLHEEVQARMQQLQELNNGNTAADVDSGSTDLAERIDQLRSYLDELRSNANAHLAQLNEQHRDAQAEYEQRWRERVASLEDNLFELLCDYGGTLSSLPDDWHLTIRLAGLGESAEQLQAADRFHVLEIAELTRCQSGDIEAASLRELAQSYSY